ncbi:hypothetical protein MMC24_001204 [Lignoscripta atroalba]|nr:hypothetical protein [Lignoscripta atroalba]
MIENRARLSKVENADDDEKVPYNPQLVTVYDLPKEVAPAARLSTRPHRSTRRGHHTSLFAQSPPKPTSLSSTPSPSRPGSPRCDLNARDSGETRRLSEPVRSSKHKRQEYNDYNSMRQCAEQYPSYPTESARDHSMLPIYNPTVTHSRHDSLNEDGRPEAHAAWILFYLSVLSPFFTLLVSLYSLLTIICLLILYPISICTTRKSLRRKIISPLSAAFHYQLKLIYSTYDLNSEPRGIVPLIGLFSPVCSIGIAIAAWVAATFWFYAAILGDPDGTKANDGRAAVLGVRRWWSKWLEKAVSREY